MTERQGTLQSERLTRQELTWLLTQEARSAAEKLRKGVVTMATTEVEGQTIPAPPGIELELDALDEAMKALASLHAGSSPRGRRGRIDLAVLVWEIAPSARVSIEPRGGTEVFGDESELRRMIQVLVGSTNPSGHLGELETPEVSIRRDASDVRVSVVLGPDSSGNSRTERAWLSRMAVRYGGRLELEGGTESLLLPADGAAEAREVESLRRELEAAQRQGEAYARELAAVFGQSGTCGTSSAPPDLDSTLPLVAGFAAAVAPQLRALSGESSAAEAADLCIDVEKVAQCAPHQTGSLIDLKEVLGEVATALSPRFDRRRVRLHLDVPESLPLHTRPESVGVLMHAILAAGCAGCPPEGCLAVKLDGNALAVEIQPSRPESDPAHSMGSNRTQSALLGISQQVGLFFASVLARHLGFELVSGPVMRGRVLVRMGAQNSNAASGHEKGG